MFFLREMCISNSQYVYLCVCVCVCVCVCLCVCVGVSVVSCRPTVKVLSPEDGKQSIVQAAQQLCRSVENKERSSQDISVSMLDILLRGTTLLLGVCVNCYFFSFVWWTMNMSCVWDAERFVITYTWSQAWLSFICSSHSVYKNRANSCSSLSVSDFQFLEDVSPLIQEASLVLTNWRGVVVF